MAQQVGKKKLFTPQMIERLRPPSTGRLEIADSNCPGLVLRVTDQGTKTLAVIFKVPGEGGVSTKGRLMAGRQHRITLGRWPGVGLKEARDKARIYLSDVTEGRNPKSVLLEQNSIRHTTPAKLGWPTSVSAGRSGTRSSAMPSLGCRRPTTSTTIWTKSGRRWRAMPGT